MMNMVRNMNLHDEGGMGLNGLLGPHRPVPGEAALYVAFRLLS
jgi:hypothetical protein